MKSDLDILLKEMNNDLTIEIAAIEWLKSEFIRMGYEIIPRHNDSSVQFTFKYRFLENLHPCGDFFESWNYAIVVHICNGIAHISWSSCHCEYDLSNPDLPNDIIKYLDKWCRVTCW